MKTHCSLSSFLVFFLACLANKKGVVQADACLTEDLALDSCLTKAGASDAVQDLCDACIEAAYTQAALTLRPQDDCLSANDIACDAVQACPSCNDNGCGAQALSKLECEITAERVSNGSACDAATCSGAARPSATTPEPDQVPSSDDGNLSSTTSALDQATSSGVANFSSQSMWCSVIGGTLAAVAATAYYL